MNNALWEHEAKYCPECRKKGKVVELKSYGQDKRCPMCSTIYFIVRNPERDKELQE